MAAHGRRQVPGFRLTVEWSDMCGRYNLISNLTVLGERFRFDATQLTLESAYNIAPTQDVLTVIAGEPRRAGFMRWGRIPFWAKNRSIGSRMINARAETVADKPSFREAFRRRRCLVLATRRWPMRERRSKLGVGTTMPSLPTARWATWPRRPSL